MESIWIGWLIAQLGQVSSSLCMKKIPAKMICLHVIFFFFVPCFVISLCYSLWWRLWSLNLQSVVHFLRERRTDTLLLTVTNRSHYGTKGDFPIQGVIVQNKRPINCLTWRTSRIASGYGCSIWWVLTAAGRLPVWSHWI